MPITESDNCRRSAVSTLLSVPCVRVFDLHQPIRHGPVFREHVGEEEVEEDFQRELGASVRNGPSVSGRLPSVNSVPSISTISSERQLSELSVEEPSACRPSLPVEENSTFSSLSVMSETVHCQ